MEGYLGQVILWAPTFTPENWRICNGQILTVREHQALFSLISNVYGGDGITNFALPNLCGRVPLGAGAAQGLTNYRAGETGGSETVTLSTAQMPAHTHTGKIISMNLNGSAALVASADEATTPVPEEGLIPARTNTSLTDSGSGATGIINAYGAPSSVIKMKNAIELNATGGGGTISTDTTGQGQAHTNMQPFLALNYIICVSGNYPARDDNQ